MMNRRQFSGTMAAAFAGGSLPLHLMRTPESAASAINGERLNRHLDALARFGANPQGGVSRVAFSDADREGRAYTMDLMRAAGLRPRVDVAGNIFGRRDGTDASLKPIVFGSHIDSVPEGGNYDGTVGSLAAIEIAQSMAERNLRTRHPLDVVVWANEEGGLYGSRAVSGQLTERELSNRAWSGRTIAEGMRFLGGDPDRLGEARLAKGDIAAYFELHIEQGGSLEADRVSIGIVEGIVGIRQWEVAVTGFSNHSGTTPMDRRQDAALAAARFVDMVHRVVRAEPGRQVGTVGRIQAFPGAPNVIPGRVLCSLELRDLDDAKIERLHTMIVREAERIGEATGTSFAFRSTTVNFAAPSDPAIRAIIADAADGLRLSARPMPSGAGHDAQSMAQLGPMGMIFIPSIGGISHSPREFSTADDIVRGAEVLMASVGLADAR